MVSLNSHVTYVCLSDRKPKAIDIPRERRDDVDKRFGRVSLVLLR